MNPQNFLGFFKTKTGRIIGFAVLFVVGLVLFGTYRKRHTKTPVLVAPLATNAVTGKPQVVQSVQRPMEVFRPPVPKNEPIGKKANSSAATQPLPVVTAQPGEGFAPICLFADRASEVPEPKKLSPVFAPFGRLIPCETIITVDSASIQTPIIGLVTENIYHAGKLVIPAGTEVHGTAQTDYQRERIASGNSWTLIWQTGEQMEIKALALDREFENSASQSGWGITDGSAGLRGEILKTDDRAEIKLFAATFLSGAAGALTEKEQTLFGSINSPSLNNAPLAGVQDVLKTYAQRIYDSIQRDGFFVRVSSGKQFYLYVLQTLDRADAMIGGIPTGTADSKDKQSPTKAIP